MEDSVTFPLMISAILIWKCLGHQDAPKEGVENRRNVSMVI